MADVEGQSAGELDTDVDANHYDDDSTDAPVQQRPPRRRPPGPPATPDAAAPSAPAAAASTRPTRPAPNRPLDALIGALNHELPIRAQADRAEDIINALEIADEFGLQIVIEGGAEAHLVADRIADAGVAVILTFRPTSDLPRRDAQWRSSRDSATALDRAGIAWALGSDVGSDSRHLLIAAQMLLQHSNVKTSALELVTARAAEMLGVADRFGSLAEGMQADIVLWSGDPGDPSSRVQRVIVGGETVYERTEADS